jgi:glutamate synthase (NADPH/NADH) small chain
MVKRERQKQREKDPLERIKTFDEVSCPFDDQTAILEAERCLQCKNAPCIKGCPVNINIPAFIRQLTLKDQKGAIDIIKQTNNLPGVCGRVCPQEEQCEKNCIRKRVDGQAVAIGALERYTADYALEHFDDTPTAPKEKIGKVAVIGAGPAGLTAAADLALGGADVTIFEAFHKAGGVLIYGIPEFRLPKVLVQKEIDKVLSLGVNLELNTVVGKTITMEEILREYDAVFIGSGAGLPKFMGIEGENLNGVFSANEYLTRVNLMKAYDPDYDTPVWRGDKVVVLGGGNVAMDAARTALRLGAQEVYVVYRRSKEEMPCRAEEAEHALEEGVKFELLSQPIRILGKDGKVTGIECLKCELTEPDETGRRRPVEIEGTNYIIECDTVIVAIGTSPNPLLTNSYQALKTTNKGTLIVDENSMTAVLNVYAGGDAVTGAATVILAMGAGKKAAEQIIQKLKEKAEKKG